MTNYQITIGYKAVICVDIKAETENEAKEKALKLFNDKGKNFNHKNISLQDDTYKIDGVLNMDDTWNML